MQNWIETHCPPFQRTSGESIALNGGIVLTCLMWNPPVNVFCAIQHRNLLTIWVSKYVLIDIIRPFYKTQCLDRVMSKVNRAEWYSRGARYRSWFYDYLATSLAHSAPFDSPAGVASNMCIFGIVCKFKMCLLPVMDIRTWMDMQSSLQTSRQADWQAGRQQSWKSSGSWHQDPWKFMFRRRGNKLEKLGTLGEEFRTFRGKWKF